MPLPNVPPSLPPRFRRFSQKTAAELLKSCVGRADDDAWRDFYERFGNWIHQRLRHSAARLGIRITHEEAREECQDVMLALFRCEEPFHGRTEDEFWAYLHRTVDHAALDLARYRRAARRRGFAGCLPVASSGIFQARRRQYRALGAREHDPEHALLLKEQIHGLARRCLELGALGREPGAGAVREDAVRLILFEGCTSHETSRYLEGALTPKQVDNVIGTLRRRLSSEGIEIRRRPQGSSPSPFVASLPPSRVVKTRDAEWSR